MNKKSIFLIMFIILNQFIISGENDPDSWINLFRNADTLNEKKELTKKLFESTSNVNESLLKEILDMEADYVISSNNDRESEVYEEWVYYSIQLVKKTDLKDVSDQLYSIFYRINKASTKAEIYLLMGKMGNKYYVNWMNEELERLNNSHKEGKFNNRNEILYFLLKGLEYYNDSSSFHQVFYCAIPNYSQRIRNLALEILKKITSDPASLCVEIITTEKNQSLKLEALSYVMESQSPTESKIKLCKTALENSMMEFIEDQSQITFQTKLRDDACYFLGELKANDPETLDLIFRKWNFDKNVGSRLKTIEALEKINTENAGKFLASKLYFIIEKKLSGGKTGFDDIEPERIIIAVIRAISNINGNAGIDELKLIKLNPDFGGRIQKEANNALIKKGEK